MSRFDDLFADLGVPLLMEVNGRPITYYASAGAAVGVALTAIVGSETVQHVEEETGRRRRQVRTVAFSLDPDSAGGGVAEPSEQAVVEIDGVQYAVDDQADPAVMLTGSTCTLKLVRRQLAAKTAAGYRARR
jgi:hypothetical protein